MPNLNEIIREIMRPLRWDELMNTVMSPVWDLGIKQNLFEQPGWDHISKEFPTRGKYSIIQQAGGHGSQISFL